MKKLLAALCWLAVAIPASAENYPSRPITMNIPYAAGGPLDTLMRILLDGLRKSLGQPIVIENVAGAGGSVGVGRVARAQPDGYTVSAGNWASHVATAGIYQLPFDMIRDFEPVTMLPAEPNVIVVRKNFPAANLAEMIAWLRQNPDAATAGTSGIGGPSYMSALFFARETGTRIRLIPYRGAGPALGDLVAGQVDMMLTGPGIVLPHRDSGAVKVFAVTAKARLDFAPDIPTTDEAGLPGFYFSAWSGLWVPKGTPKEVVERLNAAVRDAMVDPAMEHRLSIAGWDWPPADQMGPAALATFHKAEIEKWVPLIRAAGIKGE